MSAQFNDQFSSYTQQFAAAAARANRLALESAESLFGVQLKTFEKNVSATTGFLGELSEARDLGSVQSLWPKGLQIARDNIERLATANQEMFGLGLKASEAIGQLAKSQFDAASEHAAPAKAKTK
ncbi:phasin family protein [Xanthomonas sp. AmX2]|uniref:phasin family protein n=1 Tax=Xanthomonas sp. TaxID=29446 RepID=UPI001982513E|nr:phasin family protein [Xanthomonas sp.]MBN6150393.1 phasin family protein [Xanthomonas sp.]